MSIIHVVSMSGGKDSTACALLALETQPRDSLRFVFADTGNEHEATYEHLGYLEQVLGIEIVRLRADFSRQIAAKRMKLARIAGGEPESTVYGKRKFKTYWTAEAAQKALELLHPTGNPYLDMCMLKGGFPSTVRQYCTQDLKRDPCTEYMMALIDGGECDAVWSWQGVRIDESNSRKSRLQGTGACVNAFEVIGGGLYLYRPILRWSAADVFEAARLFGVQPNPLYKQGMSRVGCMPCINASKDELAEIARRFPEHIARIAAWEALVQQVTRPRRVVTFFHPEKAGGSSGIHGAVTYSRTTRGGKQFDLLGPAEDSAMCSSAYGLCE